MDILTIFADSELRRAAVSIPILSHACTDTSRQGWYHSWYLDTRITDLRKGWLKMVDVC